MSPGAARRSSEGRRRGVAVELAGIPGAGKSRLARVLADELAGQGITVTQPQAPLGPSVPIGLRLGRKAWACAGTTARDPATTARIVPAIHASGQPGPGDVAGRVVQWLVAQHVTDRALRREGASILDEGLVQCLWSIGLRGDVTPVLAAVAAAPRVSAPDVLVVVRVAPEVALERLAGRLSQHSRTQSLPESDRLAELERGDRLLGRLVDWWATDGPRPAPVLTVSGADEHERVLERIRTALA
ncbi:AAA family ATPase [Blastococcus capsensis]|uniref:AAA family ATPase n=1 Tax=Blastococcus capsensis TaxID=1564163 RepID=UPI00253FD1FE|nr:AAA family ATPase [Blastococcus capsensis]MDK3257088.1 AAA family ATPase [Blastococcus capsensis]